MRQRNEQGKGKEAYPPAPSVEEEDISPSYQDVDDDAQELDREYIQAYLAFKRLRDSDLSVQKPDQEGGEVEGEEEEDENEEDNVRIYIGTDIPESHSIPSTSSSTPTPPFPQFPRCIPSSSQLEIRRENEPRGYPLLDHVTQHTATRNEYHHYPPPRITYPETLPTHPVVPFHPRYPHPLSPLQQRYQGYARYARAPLPRYVRGSYHRSPCDIMADYHSHNSGAVNPRPERFSNGRQAAKRYIGRPYRTMADGNRVYNPDDERVVGRQYRGGYNGVDDNGGYSRGVGGSSGGIEAAYAARVEDHHASRAGTAADRAEVALFEAFAEVFNLTSRIDREVLAVKKMVEEAMFEFFGEER